MRTSTVARFTTWRRTAATTLIGAVLVCAVGPAAATTVGAAPRFDVEIAARGLAFLSPRSCLTVRCWSPSDPAACVV